LKVALHPELVSTWEKTKIGIFQEKYNCLSRAFPVLGTGKLSACLKGRIWDSIESG